jgi:hypothetical protein
MRTWQQFLEQKQVNEMQIDSLYAKAHVAVEIVKLYQPDLLNNIATIANLASGAYGVYNSGENQKIIPAQLQQSLIYYGRVTKHNLDNIPKKTLMQYYPGIQETEIQESDTIHVNVARIMREAGSDFEAIMEIAATIIHECTHESERETTGSTSEAGPVAAEHRFMAWVEQNQGMLMSRFQELQGDTVGPKGQLPGLQAAMKTPGTMPSPSVQSQPYTADYLRTPGSS